VPRNVPVNLIAVVAVGVLVALIGAVTLSSSQLVNNTVAEQFRSQELQLVSSLAQQTETYFNSLNAEIGSLAQQPAINSLPATNRDAALVLLLDRSKLVVVAHRGADATGHSVSEFDLDEAHAANQVIQLGRPLVIQNTLEDERWTPIAGADNPIRSWMGIPLRVQEKTVGVLNINSHTIGRYSPEEIELAEAFADQASVALQNARLHEFEVKQIEQELTIARDIQTSLLPSAAPEIEQLEIVAYSLPARQVSGDYFQYLPMPSGQLGIAVGDVSGKGIPAAMLMAVITTAMRDEAARNARPADLLNALNGRLLERNARHARQQRAAGGHFRPPDAPPGDRERRHGAALRAQWRGHMGVCTGWRVSFGAFAARRLRLEDDHAGTGNAAAVDERWRARGAERRR
jgi:putative methionine-R-sulfoxide reductase with GAF domain